jgi:signal transduction histidine kinase
MTRVYWLIRAAVFAVVGYLALTNPPQSAAERAMQIACFAAVGVSLLGWIAAEAFPRHRVWWLPMALGVMAAAGGVAAVTSGDGQSLIVFACIAASWAGTDAGLSASIAVGGVGAISLWVAGAITGMSFATMTGDPLLIAVSAMIGLNRRAYRVQAEQSAALLAQHERLRAEQRRADVLDERARIAREIHDVLAHSLGALGIQIQAAKALLTDHGDVDRAVEALSTAQRMAAGGLTETRRAVHALRADTQPLGEELAAAAENHRQRYRVPVTLETSGESRPVPPDATLAFLRAAQEAMVNAAKHAPGQRVALRLHYGDSDLRLSVVNGLDGVNGTPRRRPDSTGGYGLTGMRERLRLLNGTLAAGPRDNEWVVTAELPLAAASGGQATAENG